MDNVDELRSIGVVRQGKPLSVNCFPKGLNPGALELVIPFPELGHTGLRLEPAVRFLSREAVDVALGPGA